MIQRGDVLRFPVGLPLEAGGLLVDAQVSYEAWGVPSPDKALILLHDFTDSHRALGDGPGEGWGKPLIGRGLPLDPARHWVVSLGLLGSPYGSTNAAMLPPAEGLKDPPPVSFAIEDLARAAGSAMRLLGIKRPRALAGVGLGGMVALRAATLFPDLVGGVITFGAASTLSRALKRHLSLGWQQHRAGGLRKAHAEYLRRHHDLDGLVRRLGDSAAAHAFLSQQADAFFEHSDERLYVSQALTYGTTDLRDALQLITCRALLVAGAPDEIAPATRVRETYHRISAAGALAHYHEVPSEGGHATLLEQAPRLLGPITTFLGSL